MVLSLPGSLPAGPFNERLPSAKSQLRTRAGVDQPDYVKGRQQNEHIPTQAQSSHSNTDSVLSRTFRGLGVVEAKNDAGYSARPMLNPAPSQSMQGSSSDSPSLSSFPSPQTALTPMSWQNDSNQPKRAMSSGAAPDLRRLRKLSGPVPNLISVGNNLQTGARLALPREKESQVTPPQTDGLVLAHAGSASYSLSQHTLISGNSLLTNSISFLSNLASLDRLPLIFGLGATSPEKIPVLRSKDAVGTLSPECKDLRIEDVSAEVFRSPDVSLPLRLTGPVFDPTMQQPRSSNDHKVLSEHTNQQKLHNFTLEDSSTIPIIPTIPAMQESAIRQAYTESAETSQTSLARTDKATNNKPSTRMVHYQSVPSDSSPPPSVAASVSDASGKPTYIATRLSSHPSAPVPVPGLPETKRS